MSNNTLPRSRVAWLAAPALYVVGMLFAFHPVLTSGFTLVPGDLGDARLVNYLLEHTYRWVERQPRHADLWSPPFFYPERNVGAYSDIFLSAGPLYWPWRAAGASPETAFQLCFLLAASLNYLLMYLYARRCLRFPQAVSAFAAFLFAFASPRLVHVVHFQLHLQFYSVLCLYALHRLFESAERGTRNAERKTEEMEGVPRSAFHAPRWWIAVFFVGLTAQFYGSFYLGWFFCIGLGVVLVWALTVHDYRRSILWLVRSYPWSLGLWGGLSALALGDLARHYLEVVRTIGFQEEYQILWGMPNGA